MTKRVVIFNLCIFLGRNSGTSKADNLFVHYEDVQFTKAVFLIVFR